MADAELNLDELTVTTLLATAAGVASALEGNAHFPNPEPSPRELDQLVKELSAADDAYRELQRSLTTVRAQRDDAESRLRQALAREIAYVQEASGGEAAKILSANLHVEETSSFWPFGWPGQVEELTSSYGDQPGEIDLSWDAVAGASGYEIEIASDLLGERWTQGGATEKSKLTIEQLDPRTRYWFRVRAIGERGAGDWSEPVMKFTR